MPTINWTTFENLPGSAEANFERLCRSLVRRHHGQYGDFRERANQAGVEFHLHLNTRCPELGNPPRWWGWQCKWFQLASGKPLGATRRKNIYEGLEKTKKYLPGITDWVLWTRHSLTGGDQDWFYALSKKFRGIKLHLNTAADVETLLSGTGLDLRETYFGERIVTPAILRLQQELAAQPIRHRYIADVHHVVPAEDQVRRYLGDPAAWVTLGALSLELAQGATRVAARAGKLPPPDQVMLDALVSALALCAGDLNTLMGALKQGDMEALPALLTGPFVDPTKHNRVLARLRSRRSPAAPLAANLVADLMDARSAFEHLATISRRRLVALVGAAGGGKSELAIRLTLPIDATDGGVLLLGKDLAANGSLDALARGFKIAGKPMDSFEQLVGAIDAAGQRAGRRIPIVIDGLNESEDPRDWKGLLAKADVLLREAPYVMLVVTLRENFVDSALPDATEQVVLHGFAHDVEGAIATYFRHFKIDARDADLPRDLLTHPLTLRIYCEVANPSRAHVVGIDSLPRSTTTVFETYFERLVQSVVERAPYHARIHRDEVWDALEALAQALWDKSARSLLQREAKAIIQDPRAWPDSILLQLESEGLLVRTSEGPHQTGYAFAFDMFAGHFIARYLLKQPRLKPFFASRAQQAKFKNDGAGQHPFRMDAVYSLIGLTPRHTAPRQQLWELVPAWMQATALLYTLDSDPADIDRDTVKRFTAEMRVNPRFATAAFPRLMTTRGALAHPYDANFLHDYLSALTNTDRDLLWTAWCSFEAERLIDDVRQLQSRWANNEPDAREAKRLRWVMWLLTSPSHPLRDTATWALHTFALRRPDEYFKLAIESLEISDPYVPERMLAAAYGAALSLWPGVELSTPAAILIEAATKLVDKMFKPGAPRASRHALMRNYALGLVELASRVAPDFRARVDPSWLTPPFAHLPSAFDNLPAFADADIEAADKSAIWLDFGNYTIGRLVPGRGNYQFKHPEYVETRRAIVIRMMQLGYQPARMEPGNGRSGGAGRHEHDGNKVDRLGKKYSWIAYYEMWGLKEDRGALERYADARPGDASIDPSFPPPQIESWRPAVGDVFAAAPSAIADWILRGPTPNYESFLAPEVVDGHPGPWVLLEGFMEQVAPNDSRNIFTFLRGILVDAKDVKSIERVFNAMGYPGNDTIPGPPEFHYQFAGEMPYVIPPPMAATHEIEENSEQIPSFADENEPFVIVDIPVSRYSWESHHSRLNPQSGVYFPHAEIAEHQGLHYQAGSWDLSDKQGRAMLHRELEGDLRALDGHVSYLRADVLGRYLEATGKRLVWLMWGERGQDFRSDDPQVAFDYSTYAHIHKRFALWTPSPAKTRRTAAVPAKPLRIARPRRRS